VGRVRCTFAAALLLAACRHDPHSTGRGVYADIVARDVPIIEKSVGVAFKRKPVLEVTTRDQVRAFLLQQMQAADELRLITGQEAAYKALGLIPDTMNVKKLLVDVLTEQIIGLYNPKTKVLYVVDALPEEVVGPTIMHELVHALQDQYINLDSLLHAPNDDDHLLAARTVIEGEAQFEQMQQLVGDGNVIVRLPGGRERLRDLIREAQMTPRFSAAPMVVQEEALFAYINGADFVQRFKAREPGKLPFLDLPQSTEQVMHDRAYFASPRDAPIRVVLPKVQGEVYQNTLGEFDTRLFLYQHLKDQLAAARAGIGWGGDRYVVVSTSGGNGIAWVTAWDSATDAAEFVDALGQAIQKRYNIAAPSIGAGGVRTYTGRGRTVVVTPREIDGKNAVLMVDVPAGVSPLLLDFSRVTLGG
jgi:hypothetical protein